MSPSSEQSRTPSSRCLQKTCKTQTVWSAGPNIQDTRQLHYFFNVGYIIPKIRTTHYYQHLPIYSYCYRCDADDDDDDDDDAADDDDDDDDDEGCDNKHGDGEKTTRT